MKKAFTLAEVLITLTIIGVIAVLTIPNLMQKWDDQHTVSAVKKAYALFDTAIKLAIREYGTLDEWNWDTDSNAELLVIRLSDYIKIKAHCRCVAGGESCRKKNNLGWQSYKNISKTNAFNNLSSNYSNTELVSLENGMTALISRFNTPIKNPEPVTFISVDINGKKGPNRAGYDLFVFRLYTDGLHILTTGDHAVTAPAYCIMSSTHENGGSSCSNWILIKGNMDYKYRDVRDCTKGANWYCSWGD